MNRSTRIAPIVLFAVLAAHPGRADISVNWLGTPLQMFTEFSTQYYLLDLDNNGILDFTFGAGISSVGVRGEGNNQTLIYPSPPPNIGGSVESIEEGFEIGPDSGASEELDWYGSDPFFSNIITCLDGSAGYTCIGRFLIPGEFPPIMGQRAYIGVEFDIDGATHYGWIDISVANLAPGAVIYGWGYETTPGLPILAGAVPEPSTILLISAGTFGLLLMRTKRRIR